MHILYVIDKLSSNWLNYIKSYIDNKLNRLNHWEFEIQYELNLTVDIAEKRKFSISTGENNKRNVWNVIHQGLY